MTLARLLSCVFLFLWLTTSFPFFSVVIAPLLARTLRCCPFPLRKKPEKKRSSNRARFSCAAAKVCRSHRSRAIKGENVCINFVVGVVRLLRLGLAFLR